MKKDLRKVLLVFCCSEGVAAEVASILLETQGDADHIDNLISMLDFKEKLVLWGIVTKAGTEVIMQSTGSSAN